MRHASCLPGLSPCSTKNEASRHVQAGHMVLVVSDDGRVRGIIPDDPAPLAALLRVDGDLVDVVGRLEEVAVTLATLQGEARARMTAHTHRITQLEDRMAGLDTGNAVEIAALKSRVRRLEGGE